jgi:hypothetical protein
MRWILGCSGVIFVLFGGCVLVIFSDGVASDEVAFAIGAAALFLFGIWMVFKAVTTRSTAPAAVRRESGDDPP